MSETRESGVGGRASELATPSKETPAPTPTLTLTPTPDSRLPTPEHPNWRLIYSAVIIELALLILIFYAFTKAFA
jgi:hypothetical protein